MNEDQLFAVSDAVMLLAENGAHRKATIILSQDFVAKATRRHKPRKGQRITEILVTYGKPNHRERLLIKRTNSFPIPTRYESYKGGKP